MLPSRAILPFVAIVLASMLALSPATHADTHRSVARAPRTLTLRRTARTAVRRTVARVRIARAGRVAVLFDLDGTLVDSHAAMHEAVRISNDLAQTGLTEAQVAALAGGGSFETLFPTVAPTLDAAAIHRFVQTYIRVYGGIAPSRVTAYPTAAATLRQLERLGPKVVFGLATAQATGVAKDVLQRTGLSPWFKSTEAVFGAGGTDVAPKPAPDSLQLVAARLELLARDIVVYVGDSPSDVRAAHAAGMIAIAVHGPGIGYGDAGRIAAERPDHVIADLRELPGIVRQIVRERDRVTAHAPQRGPAPAGPMAGRSWSLRAHRP